MAVRVWISRSGLHDENESDGKLLRILVGFWWISQYHLATFQLPYREKDWSPDDYSLIKKDAHL